MSDEAPMKPAIGTLNELSLRQDSMQQWRRRMHAEPELAFEEHSTSDLVAGALEGFGYEVHRGIGGTGVVGRLRVGDSGRAIGLRADMDALPMQETNSFDHCSQHAGRMHACGHDGHSASLLGAAQYLAETRNFDGVLTLIFQPAEEVLGGARAMIEDGLFERFPCDAVFGYHNMPRLPVGKIGLKPGTLTAGGAFFDIRIRGKGAHAAHPESGIDPIVIACHVATALQSIVSRRVAATDSAVISVTKIASGDAYNVVPAEALLCGTVRTFRKATFDLAETNIRQLASQIAQAFGGEADIEFHRRFVSVVNDPDETRFVAEVLGDLVEPEDIVYLESPVMGSEDFAFMLEQVPGAYVFIGAADADHQVTVHHPEYDFNDRILPCAAAFYVRLVERRLAKVG